MQIVNYLLIGIAIGGVLGYLIAQIFHTAKQKKVIGISIDELKQNYVNKEIYNEIRVQALTKEKELLQSTATCSSLEEQNKHLALKINEHKIELQEIQAQFKVEFRNLANELLEEKSKRFVEINEKQVGDLITPLKEKLISFEKKVNETYTEETRERASLKAELKQIVALNNRLSDDANKLTTALKGDKKLQGDWGETQLELILEKAGLQKGLHYLKQPNYKTDDVKNVRPDYVVNLPENKHLILDSKVSLVAYEKYYNAESEDEKNIHLKTHLQNINKHISELASKKYHKLYDINSPDYVVLFVPIEPALTLALKEDIELFEKALSRNIVLVSTSTLLATLRTISHIWKQEDQRNNVKEIARIGGALYDKFVAFTDDMLKVGQRLDDAKKGYTSAMNKLVESSRKGDTIVGRVEQLKHMGANSTKQLPKQLLDEVDE